MATVLFVEASGAEHRIDVNRTGSAGGIGL